MYYFLSLGSNINPKQNMAWALKSLCTSFGPVLVFPIVHTRPCAIDSNNNFLNGLVIFQSDLTESQLKTHLNKLEEQSGRDRSDPRRSEKDRTLDLDIIAAQPVPDLRVCKTFEEPYTQQCVEAAFVCDQVEPAPDSAPVSVKRDTDTTSNTQSYQTCTISIGGVSTGHRPATIYRDHTGSHILVIEDSVNHLLQRFETALYSE